MTERWLVVLTTTDAENFINGYHSIVCHTRKAADEILKRLGGEHDFAVKDFSDE